MARMRKLRESDRKILARVFKDHGAHWVYNALFLWYTGEGTTKELGQIRRWTNKTLAAFGFLRELINDYSFDAIYTAAHTISPSGLPKQEKVA